MIGTQRNNPNFVYIGNEIYFTHIAADTSNWWTGISLTNVHPETYSYKVTRFRLAGFELFGDPNLDRAAGFKAVSFLTDELIFPHVAIRSPQWTGISLVDVATIPTTITLQAYTDRGNLLGDSNQTMAPFVKGLDLIQNLFGSDGLPAGTTYLRVIADRRTLAGFELFGTLNPSSGAPGDQLAGLAAIPF